MITPEENQEIIRREKEAKRKLIIELAILQAAAIISAGTSIATKTDQKPDEIPALVMIARQLWDGIHIEDESDDDYE